MKLVGFDKVRDGKYLKNYEITYLNKAGKEKTYEMVSRDNLQMPHELGTSPSGVSIIATCGDRLLLLREFRMGINRAIYDLCSGMLENGESVEVCIRRELREETGLQVKEIKKILQPSFAAPAVSDITVYSAVVEVEGSFADNTSDNEQIEAGLYTREEVAALLDGCEPFSSRAQTAAWFFVQGITLKERKRSK